MQEQDWSFGSFVLIPGLIVSIGSPQEMVRSQNYRTKNVMLVVCNTTLVAVKSLSMNESKLCQSHMLAT